MSFALPFAPYVPQKQLMDQMLSYLDSSPPSPYLFAAEVPTGCGKTIALLSAALQFRHRFSLASKADVDQYFAVRCHCARCVKHLATLRKKGIKVEHLHPQRGGRSFVMNSYRQSDESNDDGMEDVMHDDTQWEVPELQFQQNSTTTRKPNTNNAANLKKEFPVPPTTIFYVTRTHTQVSQIVKELRQFRELQRGGGARIRMNILASRERYCVNAQLRAGMSNGRIGVAGNNLGEVCDKLVEQNLCDAVNGFTALAGTTLSAPINGRNHFAWDIEDLVAEGNLRRQCPYYAARDLVFVADINIGTYQYLLDPLIRRESKFEASIKNHSVIIFDEAHNVLPVCQDALSTELTKDDVQEVRKVVQALYAPTASSGGGPLTSEAPSSEPQFSFALQYPRDFQLSHWKLSELFEFLDNQLLSSLEHYLDARPSSSVEESVRDALGRNPPLCNIPMEHGNPKRQEWVAKFRQVYGVVSCLGVTFNPFDIEVHVLSRLKRLLLVLRFALLRPSAFSVWVESTVSPPGSTLACRTLNLRCLDGSIGLDHLTRSCFKVIFASGTLGPPEMLAKSLRLPSVHHMSFLQTGHVIDCSRQVCIGVVSRCRSKKSSNVGSNHEDNERTNGSGVMRCTHRNLQDEQFLSDLASVIVTLCCEGMHAPVGGVLVFLPNYQLLDRVSQGYQRSVFAMRTASSSGASRGERSLPPPRMYCEPRNTQQMDVVLASYKQAVTTQRAVLFAVYRGKVSEGVNFTDDMARMVICVGCPMQPLLSPTVRAQRAFSGSEWYLHDAMLAVKQALGRCIRHASDYGSIVLLDDRYEEQYRSHLPPWALPYIKTWDTAEVAVAELKRFFDQFPKMQPTTVREDGERPTPTLPLRLREGSSANDHHGVPSRSHGLTLCSAMNATTNAVIAPAAAPQPTLHQQRPKLTSASIPMTTAAGVKRHRDGLYDTAMKLLCESVDHTTQVDRDALENMVMLLRAGRTAIE